MGRSLPLPGSPRLGQHVDRLGLGQAAVGALSGLLRGWEAGFTRNVFKEVQGKKACLDPAGLSTPLSQQLSPRNSPGRTPAAAAMATEGWGSWGSPWPGGTGTPASLSLPSGRKNQGREAALSPAGARVLTGHRLSPFWKDLLPLHEEHDSAGRAQAGTKEIGALLLALPSPRTAPGKSLPLYSHGRAGLRL